MMNVEVQEIGARWPSGDFKEVALLDVSSDFLESATGKELQKGEEVGLGGWQAMGAKLGSGSVIELISYQGHKPPCFILRVDVGCNVFQVVEETLHALNIGKESLIWVAAELKVKPGHP